MLYEVITVIEARGTAEEEPSVGSFHARERIELAVHQAVAPAEFPHAAGRGIVSAQSVMRSHPELARIVLKYGIDDGGGEAVV